MLSMVSLPVPARPRMTISILSRRWQNADLFGHPSSVIKERLVVKIRHLSPVESANFRSALPISEGTKCQTLSTGRLSQIASIADRRRSSSTM